MFEFSAETTDAKRILRTHDNSDGADENDGRRVDVRRAECEVDEVARPLHVNLIRRQGHPEVDIPS